MPDALSYDVISGRIDEIRRLPDRISLGTVRIVATGLAETSVIDAALAPEPGHAFFYAVQSRGPYGPSGYGTESASLPSLPARCEGGCPGDP